MTAEEKPKTKSGELAAQMEAILDLDDDDATIGPWHALICLGVVAASVITKNWPPDEREAQVQELIETIRTTLEEYRREGR